MIASTSFRRTQLEQQHDENSLPSPSASCSRDLKTQAIFKAHDALTSPSKAVPLAVRSPSKMPTLGDIAARLNREKPNGLPAASSPTSSDSPFKRSLSVEGGRPRLELTGRINGSPNPDRTQPSPSIDAPGSPLKLGLVLPLENGSTDSPLSPTAPSSGSTSPSKRLLAKGLPSLDEIRERMAKKGLYQTNGEPKSTSPGSPSKTKLETDGTTTSAGPSPILGTLPVSAAIKPLGSPGIVPATSPSLPNGSQAAVSALPTATVVSPEVSAAQASAKKSVKFHPLPAPPAKVTYPLQHKWTLFYDTKPGAPGTPGFNAPASPLCPPTPTTVSSGASWEANLRTIGTYDTVETFLKVFSTLHRPSQLDRNSNYHLFKDGIKPMWEDPSNANGGKWSLTFRIKNPALLDRSWMWLVLGLIGEEMDEDDHVTGAVCSLKPRGDRITLWVRNKDDHETVNRLGKKLLSLLEIENEPGISLEFSFHTSGQPVDQPDRYMSVQNPVVQAPHSKPSQSQSQSQSQSGRPASVFGGAGAAGSPASGVHALPAIPLANPPSPRSRSKASHPTTSPFARLNGQPPAASALPLANPSSSASHDSPAPMNSNRSPTLSASPGTLGHSLGLGLGLGLGFNSSAPAPGPGPSSGERSPGKKHRNPFESTPTSTSTSWRRDSSTNPPPSSTTAPSTSPSPSPFASNARSPLIRSRAPGSPSK